MRDVGPPVDLSVSERRTTSSNLEICCCDLGGSAGLSATTNRQEWIGLSAPSAPFTQRKVYTRYAPIRSTPKPAQARPAPRRTHGSLPASSAPSTSATLILSPLSGITLSTSLLDGRDTDEGPFPLTVPESRGVRSDM